MSIRCVPFFMTQNNLDEMVCFLFIRSFTGRCLLLIAMWFVSEWFKSCDKWWSKCISKGNVILSKNWLDLHIQLHDFIQFHLNWCHNIFSYVYLNFSKHNKVDKFFQNNKFPHNLVWWFVYFWRNKLQKSADFSRFLLMIFSPNRTFFVAH